MSAEIIETPVVKHNTAEHRYEIWLGDDMAGELDYSLMLGEIHFVHTGVNPAHQGKNLAAILTREALADVRAQGKNKVVPVCSYTVMYMQRHPESQDLVAGNLDEAVAACRVPNVAKFNAEHGKQS